MSMYRLKRNRWFGEIERPRGSTCTAAELAVQGMDAEGIEALIHNQMIERLGDTGAPVGCAKLIDSVPMQAAGESCEAIAARLSAQMRQKRGEPPAAAASAIWSDMASATRVALEASAAFDRRKEAERLEGARLVGASRWQTAPARPVTPGREWVRP